MSIISKLIYGISVTAGGIVETRLNRITKDSIIQRVLINKKIY